MVQAQVQGKEDLISMRLLLNSFPFGVIQGTESAKKQQNTGESAQLGSTLLGSSGIAGSHGYSVENGFVFIIINK